MYLKKLRLKGFKSFADTVELDFSQGISAIVGPNGSGKSNIIDAMRWVLGEQRTKSLRGKKMEDVIFSGTEHKAPLGYAEVVLTLDNADGYLAGQTEEVSITRRLFRSGESEYRINKKQCKLRDIQQLFMDTGLGRNGYSIISQGGIENIVNSGPMELRGIVEEAVGIVNYKTRKQEAERQLAVTQDNMDRVKDILGELKRQWKPLKNQSETAKKYLAIQEELKKLDLYHFHNKIQDISGRLEKHGADLARAEAEVKTTQARLDKADQTYQEIKVKDQQNSAVLKELNGELDALGTEMASNDAECLVLDEKIRNLKKEKENLDQQLKENREAAEKLRQEGEAFRGQRQSQMAQAAADTGRIRSLSLERDGLLGRLEAMKATVDEVTRQKETAVQKQEQLKEELSRFREDKASLETRIALTREQQVGSQAEYRDWQDHLAELEKNLSAKKSEIQEAAGEKDRLTAQTRTLDGELKALEDRMTLLKNNCQVALSKRDYLQNVQKHYSDYFPGIKLIMDGGHLPEDIRRRVYGPVGELLTVPEKYARAIDVALGGKSQNIVVSDMSAASACIQLLKRQRAGRATFLPMDNLQYRRIAPGEVTRMQGLPGVEGVAADLVAIDPRLQSVADSLLGRVVVTDTFATARQVRSAYKQYTIVTLDGEVFYPGGAVVGGDAKGKKQSPLFKKIEIQKLGDEAEDLKAQTVRCKTAWDAKHGEAATCRGRLKQAEEKFHQLEQALWKQRQRRETIGGQLSNLEASNAAIDGTLAELEGSLEKVNGRIAVVLQAIEGLNPDSGVTRDDAGNLERLSDRIAGLEKQLSECRISKARNDEAVRMQERELARLTERLTDLGEKEEKLIRDAGESEKYAGELEQDLKRRQKLIFSQRQRRAGLSGRRDTLQAQEKSLRDHLEALDREIRDLNHDLILQNEARNNLEIAGNKLISERDHEEEKIYNLYEMNGLMAEEWLSENSLEGLDLTEAHQRELRREIGKIGPVNVNAIEDFQELDERYQFIGAQYADLEEGKKEVESIIADLYRSMEKQFDDGFKILQDKFSRIFTILFEGGKAQLKYTDPDNVLESGIELAAQPPGKNLRHISLLSGGEKSMTAIALLFSFLELNPAPFCVIDEIDAALDDHNIYRFTSYLKGIAEENQFIIITHRKTTLEVCDAIYGVSMAKSGISKLVSIRLSDYVEPGA